MFRTPLTAAVRPATIASKASPVLRESVASTRPAADHLAVQHRPHPLPYKNAIPKRPAANGHRPLRRYGRTVTLPSASGMAVTRSAPGPV